MSFLVALVVAAVSALVVLAVIRPWLRRRRDAETSHYDSMRGPDSFDPTADNVRDP
ncbi:MAG: hypothetical protein U5K30_07920 [Acidimicrobiales bacterium]|nr:hypothetical protein [Acidimicrobiales bacterium]